MTDFRIERLTLAANGLATWALQDPRHRDWPVVYTLNGGEDVYVGETRDAASRLRQHLASPAKQSLGRAHVLIDETFNKSACQDLESYLIRLFAGDGRFQVQNRNVGIVNADYYDRAAYRERFGAIFEEMRTLGLFQRTLPEIHNSDLFKLSPFKALAHDQAVAVEDIMEGLFDDLEAGRSSTIVIEGAPGTGKTVVAIYLMKLLLDISRSTSEDEEPADGLFADFFTSGHPELLRDLRVGLVIPQQALRKSVRKVFKRTPGLEPEMVLTAFDVGLSERTFDLLIVDETHRLNQRANQSSAMENKRFPQVNERLFGADDLSRTQLDWIRHQSAHQIFLVDGEQSVRPADLSAEQLKRLTDTARSGQRFYRLATQMRVQAGEDYVGYVRQLLSDHLPEPRTFATYEFRMYDDLGAMTKQLATREAEVGLARLLAGYAWPWRSKKDKTQFDIELDGIRRQWNTTETDWVLSPTAVNEVGSIHTIQGYDVNYAGVIIGPDLRWDKAAQRLVFDRSKYFDGRGKQDNRQRGITYTDQDLLTFVRNIYSVLLTRGIYGTYVYVVDPDLRERLRDVIPAAA